jgi:hypothetical protein
MTMKFIFGVAVCLGAALAQDVVVFHEQEDVFVVKEVVHLTIKMDLRLILDVCDDFRKALRAVSPDWGEGYVRDAWYGAVAVLQSTCDFDHIWPGESKRTKNPSNKVVVRDKRQAMMAVGVLGTLFGTLFGLYSWQKIQHLSTKIHDLEHQQHLGLMMLKNHETRMRRVEDDLSTVNDTLAQLVGVFKKEKSVQEKLFWLQNYQLQLDILTMHVQVIRTGWGTLHSHRFPLDWMETTASLAVYRRLQDRAERMGGVLMTTHPMDMFDLPTSFVCHDKDIYVFLHVPIIKERMQLFEYISVPIRVPGNGSFIQVTAKKDFILVSKKNSLHKEMTGEELRRRCKTLGSNYLCEHLGVFNRRMESSCLGSLFVNSLSGVHSCCETEMVTEDWMVRQMSAERFLLFSREPLNLMYECRNGTRNNVVVHGIQLVEVPEQCEVFSSEFELIPSAEFSIRMSVIHEVNWNRSSIFHPWRDQETERELTKMIIDLGTI